MKTWKKIVICFVTLGGVVATYVSLESAPGMREQEEALRPSTRFVTDSQGPRGLGPGARPWVNQLNEHYELAYRFRGDNFDPQSNTAVKVTHPAFEFFTEDQMIQVMGETGMVYLPSREASAKTATAGPALSGMPTRGTMKDVTIKVFEVDRATGEPSPNEMVSATMDNVSFDNDTLRIETEGFTKDGRDVPRDMVPVVVRGRDYDFDGEGLSMTISKGDRSIQRLKIDHGHRLLIKHPGAMDTQVGTTARPGSPGGLGWDAPGTMLASSDPKATAPPVKEEKRQIYRATFYHELKIVQGDGTVRGEQMQVDFSSKASEVTSSAAPSTAPSGATPAVPVAGALIPPGAATVPTPTTGPAEDPVLITWNGPLELVGNGGDPTLASKQAVVTITGNPVVLEQRGMVAQAPAVQYRKLEQLATLVGSDASPVVLSDDKHSVVRTPRLTWDKRKGEAVLTGTSVVRADADSGDGTAKVPTVISWTDKATLSFASAGGKGEAKQGSAGSDNGAKRIRTAVLEGDVSVDHPEMNLASKKLTVEFDPRGPRTGEDSGAFGGGGIASAHAEGSVLARMPGTGGKPDSAMQGDELFLFTKPGAGGKRYPSEIKSNGNVRATDGKQDLTADHLAIELLPSRAGLSAGSSKVQALTATGNVVARTDDGTLVRTDTLVAKNVAEAPDITLSGRMSTVEGKDGGWKMASASDIHYTKNDGQAAIPGPGVLTGIQKAEAPGEVDKPFKATWTDSAHLDLKANRVDVAGNVSLETRDKDGGVDTGTGKTLTVTLVDADKTATANGAKPDQDTSAGPLGKKQVKSFDFGGDVRLQSFLASDTEVLRQVNLAAERLLYDASKGLDVPVPGTLFFFDRTQKEAVKPGGPSTPEVAPKPENAPKPGEKLPSGKGTTGIDWRDSMDYDLATHAVTFNGAVHFAHRPLAPAANADPNVPEEPFKLNSDKMVATLASSAKQDPSVKRSGSADLESSQLRSVVSTGNVVFTGRGVMLHAQEIDFDPEDQMLVAIGSEREPVQFDEVKGAATGTATYLRYNLKTGQIEELNNPTGSLSRAGLKPSAADKKKR